MLKPGRVHARPVHQVRPQNCAPRKLPGARSGFRKSPGVGDTGNDDDDGNDEGDGNGDDYGDDDDDDDDDLKRHRRRRQGGTA